jgi:hypothetical protein
MLYIFQGIRKKETFLLQSGGEKGKYASLFGCPLCVVSEIFTFLFNASIVVEEQRT